MDELVGADARIVSAGGERMRLSRQRRREGMFCLNVEVRFSEVDRLVTLGLLCVEDRNDQTAILRALYTFLDRSAIGCAHPHPDWRSNAAG